MKCLLKVCSSLRGRIDALLFGNGSGATRGGNEFHSVTKREAPPPAALWCKRKVHLKLRLGRKPHISHTAQPSHLGETPWMNRTFKNDAVSFVLCCISENWRTWFLFWAACCLIQALRCALFYLSVCVFVWECVWECVWWPSTFVAITPINKLVKQLSCQPQSVGVLWGCMSVR